MADSSIPKPIKESKKRSTHRLTQLSDYVFDSLLAIYNGEKSDEYLRKRISSLAIEDKPVARYFQQYEKGEYLELQDGERFVVFIIYIIPKLRNTQNTHFKTHSKW